MTSQKSPKDIVLALLQVVQSTRESIHYALIRALEGTSPHRCRTWCQEVYRGRFMDAFGHDPKKTPFNWHYQCGTVECHLQAVPAAGADGRVALTLTISHIAETSTPTES